MPAPTPIVLSGRPRKRVPTVDWKIVVPADVAVLVEEALPGRNGKPKYGARAELIEQLLRRWLSEQDVLSSIPEGFDSPSPPSGSVARDGEDTDTSQAEPKPVSPVPPASPPFSDEGI